MSSTTMRSARRISFTASGGLLHAGQVLEQEHESGRRRGRIGDHHVDPSRLQQMRQPRLAAQPIAVGIDVRGEADPLSRMERGGEGARGLEAVGRKNERHEGKITAVRR